MQAAYTYLDICSQVTSHPNRGRCQVPCILPLLPSPLVEASKQPGNQGWYLASSAVGSMSLQRSKSGDLGVDFHISQSTWFMAFKLVTFYFLTFCYLFDSLPQKRSKAADPPHSQLRNDLKATPPSALPDSPPFHCDSTPPPSR